MWLGLEWWQWGLLGLGLFMAYAALTDEGRPVVEAEREKLQSTGGNPRAGMSLTRGHSRQSNNPKEG